jgi:demethylspheroidene O-methyltransferase
MRVSKVLVEKNSSVTNALVKADLSISLRDRVRLAVDDWMTRPELYRWSIANPLTRWLTQRRTREIFDLMSGFVHSQVLLSCVRLNLFGLVKQAPATLDDLAGITRVPAAALQRLVFAAVALRLLEHRSGQCFGLGPLGAPIATHEGIRAMIEHNNLLYHDMAEPTDFLLDSWRGQMAGYWPYAHMEAPATQTKFNHDHVNRYSELMAASQTFVIEEILNTYAFGRHKCMLDVGAGKGRFIAALARREPHLSMQWFDLPPVMPIAKQFHASFGFSSGIEYHPGSFFDDELPRGADLVTLIRVAHDHADEAMVCILKKIYSALPTNGTLLLAEPMAQEIGHEAQGDAYFHFYLLAMGSGRLRKPSELKRMLRESGFTSVEQLDNAMPIHARILIARKI